MDYDIFISYSRRDLDKVKAVKADIERLTGAKCWMDLEGIESGTPRFTQAIIDGIERCKVFLFMRSQHSQASKYALLELNYASDQSTSHVVIVNIDDSEMAKEFQFLYSLTDTIDWNNKPQQEKLLRDLRRWVGKPQADADVNDNTIPPLQQTAAPVQHVSSSTLSRYRKWIVAGIVLLVLVVAAIFLFSPTRYTASEMLAKAEEYHKAGNDKESAEWYRKAADQGNALGQYNLGYMYLIGEGVEQNSAEALRLFRLAANQGQPDAQCYLGYMYENGLEVEQNQDEALRWYRMAAENGQVDAQNYLNILDSINNSQTAGQWQEVPDSLSY